MGNPEWEHYQLSHKGEEDAYKQEIDLRHLTPEQERIAREAIQKASDNSRTEVEKYRLGRDETRAPQQGVKDLTHLPPALEKIVREALTDAARIHKELDINQGEISKEAGKILDAVND